MATKKQSTSSLTTVTVEDNIRQGRGKAANPRVSAAVVKAKTKAAVTAAVSKRPPATQRTKETMVTASDFVIGKNKPRAIDLTPVAEEDSTPPWAMPFQIEPVHSKPVAQPAYVPVAAQVPHSPVSEVTDPVSGRVKRFISLSSL